MIFAKNVENDLLFDIFGKPKTVKKSKGQMSGVFITKRPFYISTRINIGI